MDTKAPVSDGTFKDGVSSGSPPLKICPFYRSSNTLYCWRGSSPTSTLFAPHTTQYSKCSPHPPLCLLSSQAREYILQKGTSKRIWGELYKVLDSSDVVIQVIHPPSSRHRRHPLAHTFGPDWPAPSPSLPAAITAPSLTHASSSPHTNGHLLPCMMPLHLFFIHTIFIPVGRGLMLNQYP